MISRRHSIYREYFTQNDPGLETFLKCVEKKFGLPEETPVNLGTVLNDPKTTLYDAAGTVVGAVKNLWRKIW